MHHMDILFLRATFNLPTEAFELNCLLKVAEITLLSLEELAAEGNKAQENNHKYKRTGTA